MAKSNDAVRIAGVVFGDTKDAAQFKMLNPYKAVPAAMDDGDTRYDDANGNRIAVGNYAFFKQYANDAIRKMAPGWQRIDLLAEDKGGQREWNYDPRARADMSTAAWELADDIRTAAGKGSTATGEPKEVVVYSAGGGAHVAAEAIAYLRNSGMSEATLVRYFAVVQHGDTNWWSNQEPEATTITRPYTIAISEQDPALYTNGDTGPGLKLLVRDGVWLSGAPFGAAYAEATSVAQGLTPFKNLPQQATFKATKDGSDAGSHAFAADTEALLAAWDNRLRPGENIARGDNAEHLIDTGDGYRQRVIYAGFDWQDAQALMNGTATASLEHTHEATSLAVSGWDFM